MTLSSYCFVYQEWDMLRERVSISEDKVERTVMGGVSDTAFCTRMQENRIRLRLTVRELADKLCLSQRTVSMYENGTEIPSEIECKNIKRTLQMS